MKELDDPSPLPPPVEQQGLIPELGEHLNEGRLPHAGLSLDDDGDPTLVALVNVQHLDGVVEREDVGGVIDDGDAFVIVGLDVQCPREEAVEDTTVIEFAANRHTLYIMVYNVDNATVVCEEEEREGGKRGRERGREGEGEREKTHIIDGISTPILMNCLLSSSGSFSGWRDINPRLPPPSLKS